MEKLSKKQNLLNKNRIKNQFKIKIGATDISTTCVREIIQFSIYKKTLS